jgi:hypothetical protein
MAVDWFWAKQREIRCPGDHVRFVFKNVDHAFPYYFRTAKASVAAAVSGLKRVKGKIAADYESQIEQTLFSIDNKNATLQSHLRAAYILYAAAPCEKIDSLERAVEALRQDENELRTAELLIQQLVQVLDNPNGADVGDAIKISLDRIVMLLTARTPAQAMIGKMKNVRADAEEWKR